MVYLVKETRKDASLMYQQKVIAQYGDAPLKKKGAPRTRENTLSDTHTPTSPIQECNTPKEPEC